jgi:hypothetical protein
MDDAREMFYQSSWSSKSTKAAYDAEGMMHTDMAYRPQELYRPSRQEIRSAFNLMTVQELFAGLV